MNPENKELIEKLIAQLIKSQINIKNKSKEEYERLRLLKIIKN
jgi:hypothetical protein